MLPSLPRITRTLIIVNIGVFLAQFVMWNWLVGNFALWPLSSAVQYRLDGAPRFQVWQVVSYAFLHGSTMHLFFNMLALYMFGGELERVWGPRRYLIYYFACVIGAAAAQLAVTSMQAGRPYPTLGASGGVFGLLLAFGMMYPRRIIVLIFPPIPMPAWLFVTLYGVVELVLGVTGTQAGVAHFAHLGGMAAGFVLIYHWRRRRPYGG
jgi:membrane associated rhomboid family serine protease